MVMSLTSGRSRGITGLCLPLAILLLFLAAPIHSVDGADYTVFQGIVDRVSGKNITVSGHDFNAAAARIVSPSGTELPFSEVASGRKVDLLLKGRDVGTIVVYSANMVE